MKPSVAITFTIILVLGCQLFECVPLNNRGNQMRSTTRLPTTTIKPTPTQSRESRTNCIANVERDSSDPRQAIGKHPVSRLFEIQAKNHQVAPVFKDIAQRGEQNKVEFHIQVSVNNKSASAWGHTKKDARRRAAIELLTQMGLQVEADASNTLNNC
ncbi:uncharacterized protein LOC116341295 [Contarinia nasturtii]|uniref:uncharacterized protein LOC116341295 n=1 Tax=Contarinia nasturtii TaxID=265458 RepID=UPI0012D4A36E|nr:uncharacterized protein LOC116341295 [Contarinia nasturtii]